MRRSGLIALIASVSIPPAAMAETALPTDEAAIAVFTATFSEDCMGAFLEADGQPGALIEPPQRFDLESPTSWGDPVPVALWQFRCEIYAYNTSQIFLISTDMGGVLPVALARPVLKIEYDAAKAAPGEEESVVKLLEVDGWQAGPVALNASFDPGTLTISSYSFWRGLGDASEGGLWRLYDGGFRLVSYEVDASYDGESTPVTLVDFR